MRYLLALVLGIFLTATVTPAYAQQTCSSPPSADAAGQVTVTGDGKLNTLPFNLQSGAYTIRWSGSTKSQLSGNLILYLKRTDGGVLGTELLVNTILNREKASANGETQVYSVKTGAYYLDVMAPGEWSVTITPQ